MYLWNLYGVIRVSPVQDGKTALHLASEQGHVSVVRVLVKHQVDINLQDKVCFDFAVCCRKECGVAGIFQTLCDC